MRRVSNVGFRVACALGLVALGLVNSPGQEGKGVPKETRKVEAKAAEVKAVEAVKAVFVNAAARLAVDDNAIQQWEQAYGPQFRHLHRTELHFLRLVAQPTRQQYERIAAESEPAIKEAIRGLMAGRSNLAGGQADPRATIAAAVAKAARNALPPEQAARYQEELDLRAAARKQAVVLSLVAMIDNVLMLSTEQREKLRDVLANNWDDSWNQPQLLLMGGRYFPALPEAKIVPLLSDAQRDVWRGIPKGTVRFGMSVPDNVGMDIDEVWDDDKAPKKPRPAAGQAAPAPKVPEK